MMDDQTKLNIAVTRFAAFVSDLPVSPNEEDVSEYHRIVELFEEGCGLDLSRFEIAPDRLKSAIGGPMPFSSWPPKYSRKRCVEFGYFLGQVRALTDYLMIALGGRVDRTRHAGVGITNSLMARFH
jgi:hypothetical protein